MSRGGLDERTEIETPEAPPAGEGWWGRVVPYLPSVGGWQRSTRGQAAVARARAHADRGLLTAFAVLVVLAAGLAVGVPRQMSRTVDGGAREAVRAAGPAAAVDVQYIARLVESDVGFGESTDEIDVTTADEIRTTAAAMGNTTPDALAALLEPATVSALSEPMTVTSLRDPDSPRPRPAVELFARVGWADPRTGGEVTWVQGQPPTVAPVTALRKPVIPVGVSEQAALSWQLAPGSRLTTEQTGSGRSTLLVTGVFRVARPDEPVWQSLDSAQRPVPRDPERTGASIDEVTFLVDGSTLPVAQAGLGSNGLRVHLRRPIDLDEVTGERLRAVLPVLRSYERDDLSPLPSDPSADFVSTLPGVVATYLGQARAVVAQLSVAVAAVIGVAAVVLLLAVQLLTRRRRPGLALQHARGASLTAIGTGLLLESVVVAGVAAVAGGLLGFAVTPGGDGGLGAWLLVLAVALSLGPVLGMLAARSAWATRKTPANRRARSRGRVEVELRRAVAELLVVVVAVAAVVSLRVRGLSTSSATVDPLLAAAPLLLTAAVTVVVLRVYPWPVKLASLIARRRRGALPVVAAARAGTALSWSPLLALTLSIGLMVGTGLIRTTLEEGQVTASWERIGADVRVDLNDAPPSPPQLADLKATPGVFAACNGHLGEGWMTSGAADELVRVLAVDPLCYRKVLEAGGLGTADALADLPGTMPDGSVRGLLAGGASWPEGPQDLTIVGGPSIRVTSIARTSLPELGWKPGPLVILDSAGVRAAGWEPPDTVLWLVGPASSVAVEQQARVAAWDVHDRRAWLAERSSGGVIADMSLLLVVALGLLAVLAAIAMVQTVSAGAAERGRAVSLLRTLGLSVREGRRLTFSELIPLVVVGVAAGAGAGFGLVLLLGPSLGMEQVTGGVTPPELRLAPSWALGVLAAALAVVLVAAVVESLLQRTQRLASVLRVGETR